MSGRPCGKVRYDSGREAERALERARDHMRRQSLAKKVQRAYHCPKCRGWHLTAAPYDPTTPRSAA